VRRILLVALLAALAGCESERTMPNGKTEKCVGLNGGEKPNVKYEYSARNIIIGIAGAEVIAPPVVVLLNELKCPVVQP